MAERFSVQVEEWAKRAELSLDLVLQKVALDGFSGVLAGTRVDTGRLRGSWRIGVNAVDTSTLDKDEVPSVPSEGAPASGQETQKALAVLPTAEFGDTIHITNSLPYAEVIDAQDDIIGTVAAQLAIDIEDAIAEVQR
jgi:hypothetical protein